MSGRNSKYNGDYAVDPCFKNDTQLENDGVTATTTIEKNTLAKTGDYMVTIGGNAVRIMQIIYTECLKQRLICRRA